MPAKNIEHVRPLVRQEEQHIFEEWAAIAEDTASFSTQILDWCVQEHPSNGWNEAYKMVYIALLRHMAELLDALPQSLINRQISVAHMLLRGLLETAMSLLFILKENSDQRVEAYHYMDAIRAIKRRDMQDNETEAYKAYDSLHLRDIILGPDHAGVAPDLPSHRQRRENELKLLRLMPHAGPEYDRLQRLPKKERPKHIEWYMFFSNVRSIRQMAVEVGLGASYDFLYTRYSGKVHPVGVIQDAIIHDIKGNAIAMPLRSLRRGHEATSAREIVVISSKCAMLCFASYAERFHSSHEEEIKNWWTEHSTIKKVASDKIQKPTL